MGSAQVASRSKAETQTAHSQSQHHIREPWPIAWLGLSFDPGLHMSMPCRSRRPAQIRTRAVLRILVHSMKTAGTAGSLGHDRVMMPQLCLLGLLAAAVQGNFSVRCAIRVDWSRWAKCSIWDADFLRLRSFGPAAGPGPDQDIRRPSACPDHRDTSLCLLRKIKQRGAPSNNASRTPGLYAPPTPESCRRETSSGFPSVPLGTHVPP